MTSAPVSMTISAGRSLTVIGIVGVESLVVSQLAFLTGRAGFTSSRFLTLDSLHPEALAC